MNLLKKVVEYFYPYEYKSKPYDLYKKELYDVLHDGKCYIQKEIIQLIEEYWTHIKFDIFKSNILFVSVYKNIKFEGPCIYCKNDNINTQDVSHLPIMYEKYNFLLGKNVYIQHVGKIGKVNNIYYYVYEDLQKLKFMIGLRFEHEEDKDKYELIKEILITASYIRALEKYSHIAIELDENTFGFSFGATEKVVTAKNNFINIGPINYSTIHNTLQEEHELLHKNKTINYITS